MKKIIWCISLLFLFTATYAYTDRELESANILWEQGIIVNQAWTPENYKLDDTITRREFMKVVVNRVWQQVSDTCDGKFSDMNAWDWWCKYTEWWLRNEFVANNRNFRPNDPITKAESMKLILKARSLARQEFNDDWRYNDMQTAYSLWIISGSYTDYDSYARRWWIFEAVATEIWTYSWSNNNTDTSSDWSWNSSSTSWQGSSNSSSSPGSSSSSGNSSSSWWNSWNTNPACTDADWKNCVP